VNRATLIGNLGRDPEVRRMNSGDAVVSFSLATTESWRDKMSGERREAVEWHNIVIFNQHIGKIAEQYLRKGSKCLVEGAIKTREYQDRDGNPRRTTEIVMSSFDGKLELLGSKRDGDDTGSSAGARGGQNDGRGYGDNGQSQNGGSYANSSARSMKDLDDDIPFSAEWR